MDIDFELIYKNEECLPIKFLEILNAWEPPVSAKHNVHPLEKRESVINSPKTLLCHDMKGGYLDDRFLNGSGSTNGYYFIHWSMIDIFVYFSHHLVTIPPCSWITSAHRNGVKILGTFITEWDAGAETCENIFYSTASVNHTCKQLVRIAQFYQFDGWLINIENKLKQDQVILLEEFVKLLTIKMHQSQEDSLVIWYDSIIETGELKWQNELNDLNKNFFHACDGIFLNYNWTKDTLNTSLRKAGLRKYDVFVGVDVFGRGCLGGGGFSTDIAVTAARDFNLSVAIFAPGWVYEALDVKDFKDNQYKFWNLLIELCAPRVIKGLPYYTSFCAGFGQKLFRYGKVQDSNPWFNMNLQQPQPSFHYTNCSVSGSMMTLYTDDSFNGGGCLKLTGKFSENTKFIYFGILSCNFAVNTFCSIKYTFKTVHENIKVALIFDMYNKKKFYKLAFCDECDSKQNLSVCMCSTCGNSDVRNLIPALSKVIKHGDEITPWIKRKYRMFCHDNEECLIKKIGVQISCDDVPSTEISVLLGELLISPYNVGTFFYEDLNVVLKNELLVLMECVLKWSFDYNADFSDLYIYINGMKQYICTTSQLYYEFKSHISISSGVEFMLSPRCFGKYLQPLFLRIPLNIGNESVN